MGETKIQPAGISTIALGKRSAKYESINSVQLVIQEVLFVEYLFPHVI